MPPDLGYQSAVDRADEVGGRRRLGWGFAGKVAVGVAAVVFVAGAGLVLLFWLLVLRPIVELNPDGSQRRHKRHRRGWHLR